MNYFAASREFCDGLTACLFFVVFRLAVKICGGFAATSAKILLGGYRLRHGGLPVSTFLGGGIYVLYRIASRYCRTYPCVVHPLLGFAHGREEWRVARVDAVDAVPVGHLLVVGQEVLST